MRKLDVCLVLAIAIVFATGQANAKMNHSEITVTKRTDKASSSLAPMSKGNNAGSSTTIKSQRYDPYKNFKFRVH